MNEVLKISNFLCIDELTIELKKINVVIGPQASGKSVVAKLSYFFKQFIWELFYSAIQENEKSEFDERIVGRFFKLFPSSGWGNDDFNIEYRVSDIFIRVSRGTGDQRSSIVINHSAFFNEEFLTIKEYISRPENKVLPTDFPAFSLMMEKIETHYIESLKSQLCLAAPFNPVFVPAGRSFFSILQSNIFFLRANNAFDDPILLSFGSYFEQMKKNTTDMIRLTSGKMNLLKKIDNLCESILCGKYSRSNGEDYLVTRDERFVKISNASSGQQETLPLTLLLSSLPFDYGESARTVYIEEPEAHLFPKAQRDIIELISLVYNNNKENLQFFITTHSPYILTSINNLLQAGTLEQELSGDAIRSKKLDEIVAPQIRLYPEDVAAYMIKDGRSTSIIDKETKIIDANLIDEVSSDLAVQFDQLLEL